MSAHRAESILKVFTLVFVLAGAALWLLPPLIPESSIGPPAPTATSATARSDGGGPGVDSTTVASVVGSNIFSTSRAAPVKRYTLTAEGAEANDAPMTSDATVLPPSPPPRVLGTMTGPGGATALIQGDSAGSSGRLYREGDRIGSYRIVRISSTSVTVRGPAGKLELKIEPREDRLQ